MGIRVPKSITDYPGFGLDVGLKCNTCGRIAVCNAGDVDAFYNARRLSTRLPLNTSILSCKCGSRDVTSIAVSVARRPAPHEMYGRMLHPIYIIRPPKPAQR